MNYEHDLTDEQINDLEKLYKCYPHKVALDISWTSAELDDVWTENDNNISGKLKTLNTLYQLRLITGRAWNVTHANCRLTKVGHEFVAKYLSPIWKYHRFLGFTSVHFNIDKPVNIDSVYDFLKAKNIKSLDYFDDLPRSWSLSNNMIDLLQHINSHNVVRTNFDVDFMCGDAFDALHCLDHMGVVKCTQHNNDYITSKLTPIGQAFINLFILPNYKKKSHFMHNSEISDYLIHAEHIPQKIADAKKVEDKQARHHEQVRRAKAKERKQKYNAILKKVRHAHGMAKLHAKAQLCLAVSQPSIDFDMFDMLAPDKKSDTLIEYKHNLANYSLALCQYGHKHVYTPMVE